MKRPQRTTDAEARANRSGETEPSSSVSRGVLGSLLLNSLYEPEGQQRAGTIFLLRSLIPRSSPGRKPALEELSSQPINTNPWLAGLALGPLLAVVHDPATSEEEVREQARRTRSTLGPAIGALGDRLRFAALEPCASGGFLVAALIWPPSVVLWYLLGLGVQLHWSVRGWRIGLPGQARVLQWLGERILDRWIGRCQRLARVLMGMAIGFVAIRIAAWGSGALLAFGILLAAGLFLGRRGTAPFALAWLGAGAALVLGALGLER